MPTYYSFYVSKYNVTTGNIMGAYYSGLSNYIDFIF